MTTAALPAVGHAIGILLGTVVVVVVGGVRTVVVVVGMVEVVVDEGIVVVVDVVVDEGIVVDVEGIVVVVVDVVVEVVVVRTVVVVVVRTVVVVVGIEVLAEAQANTTGAVAVAGPAINGTIAIAPNIVATVRAPRRNQVIRRGFISTNLPFRPSRQEAPERPSWQFS